MRTARYILGFCYAAALSATAFSQSLTWLGTLGGSRSEALAVSADGSVVVGSAQVGNQLRAFRWTAQTGMQDLSTLSGEFAARGVSADGSVIVGYAHPVGSDRYAFRWTQATGMVNLGTLGGNWSEARGVSADGTIVAGYAIDAWFRRRPFRWTQAGGMQDIAPATFARGEANAIAFNGSAIVGEVEARAFRWRSSGFDMLGTLGASNSYSIAHGVSPDGAIVVGESSRVDQLQRAFRWTQASGIEDIGSLGGTRSVAYGVSSNDVIVGMSLAPPANNRRAFIWTRATGMLNLNDVYSSLLQDGSILTEAYAITPDGRYIVGRGFNRSRSREEAFLLDRGPQCVAHNGDVDANGCVDDADLLAILFAFGQSGNNLGRVDVNCDATVDDADLLVVLFNFGSGC